MIDNHHKVIAAEKKGEEKAWKAAEHQAKKMEMEADGWPHVVMGMGVVGVRVRVRVRVKVRVEVKVGVEVKVEVEERQSEKQQQKLQNPILKKFQMWNLL